MDEKRIDHEVSRRRQLHDRNVHDLGFIFLSTYLPWYQLTGQEHLHQVLVQAGRTLAMRFMEKGQYLRSFVAPESLFIDIMMNVPIIFYAARETGDAELRRWLEAHRGRGLSPRRLRYWELVLGLPHRRVSAWIEAQRSLPWTGRLGA